MPELDFSVVLSRDFRSWLLRGFALSLQLTAAALHCALPLAAIVALLRLAPARPLRALG